MKPSRRIIVVGGGAAGLLAAGSASEAGARVTLLERGPKLGRKLRLTGKGRCNLTNTADRETFVRAFAPNGRFLYGPFSRFFREDLLALLSRLGVRTKVERGGRVFPESDSAVQVAEALEGWVRASHVDVRLNSRVKGLSVEGARVSGVELYHGSMDAAAVIVAAGGLSYPGTGSSGDGYALAEAAGHTIVPTRPALAPLLIEEPWVGRLSGLALKNVGASLVALDTGATLAREVGEMLFTHTGVSGPIILTLSRVAQASGLQESVSRVAQASGLQEPLSRVAQASGLQESVSRVAQASGLQEPLSRVAQASGLQEPVSRVAQASGLQEPVSRVAQASRLQEPLQRIALDLDLKPALTRDDLRARFIREFARAGEFGPYMRQVLPRSLAALYPAIAEIEPTRRLSSLTAHERERLIERIKALRLHVAGVAPIEEAIVTAGGVSLPEIDPRTMMSSIVSGLYFAGEVVNLDAVTGGYNLQAAFTMGAVAGKAAAACSANATPDVHDPGADDC